MHAPNLRSFFPQLEHIDTELALAVPNYHRVIHSILQRAQLELIVLRLDQLDSIASGNKYFKLLYHLERIEHSQAPHVMSFGGKHSNHLHALAYACRELETQCVLWVRIDENEPLTPTLHDAQAWGAVIKRLSRGAYRNRHDAAFIAQLSEQFIDPYWIAEGGADLLGVYGARYLGYYLARCYRSLNQQLDESGQSVQPITQYVLALAVGTGSTLAGVLSGLEAYVQRDNCTTIVNTHRQQKDTEEVCAYKPGCLFDRVVAIPVLKPRYLQQQLQSSLSHLGYAKLAPHCELDEQGHYGGYARLNPSLWRLAESMHEQGLPLDPVYSIKVLQRLLDKVQQGEFSIGTRIIMLHTGGLQGARGVKNWPVNYGEEQARG